MTCFLSLEFQSIFLLFLFFIRKDLFNCLKFFDYCYFEGWFILLQRDLYVRTGALTLELDQFTYIELTIFDIIYLSNHKLAVPGAVIKDRYKFEK